ECRKVLFRQKVTAIRRVSFRALPASETAWEFAGDAFASTVKSRSIWVLWLDWLNADPPSFFDGFVLGIRQASSAAAARSGRSERPVIPATCVQSLRRAQPRGKRCYNRQSRCGGGWWTEGRGPVTSYQSPVTSYEPAKTALATERRDR